MVTKRELFKCGIKGSMLLCSENESIDHTPIKYKMSFGGLIQHTNHRSPQLWRTFYSELLEKSTTNKLNYVTLFMGYSIYSCKLNNKPIHLHDFVDAVQQKTWMKHCENLALGRQYWVKHLNNSPVLVKLSSAFIGCT